VARLAAGLAIAATVAGLIAWLALRELLRGDEGSTVALVLAALLLAAPPALLGLLVGAIRALLALPEQLRRLPAEVGSRVGEVRRRAAEVGQARTGWSGVKRSFGLLLAAAGARDVLEFLTPAAFLLRPWLLVAAPLAMAAAAIEIVLGVVGGLWLAA
jgi:hypothetical protein